MINSKLRQLYIDTFSTESPCVLQLLRNKRRTPEVPAYPLLIKVNEEALAKADIKIMIFGQETNSWEQKVSEKVIPIEESGMFVDKTVDVFMNYYKDFLAKKINENSKRSPFWDFHYQLKNNKFSTKQVELIWNNIYKIGNFEKRKNRPSSSIREFENKYFDIIQQEVNIIKPNLIVFFTGPKYDGRLTKKFEVINKHSLKSDIPSKELAKLDLGIGIPAYRTYHPHYLRRQKKTDYIDIIIDDYLKGFKL